MLRGHVQRSLNFEEVLQIPTLDHSSELGLEYGDVMLPHESRGLRKGGRVCERRMDGDEGSAEGGSRDKGG